MFLLDALSSLVLLAEMVELLQKGEGVIQEADHRVQTVHHTDTMGFELGARWVVHVHALEEVPCVGVALKQTVLRIYIWVKGHEVKWQIICLYIIIHFFYNVDIIIMCVEYVYVHILYLFRFCIH